MPDEINEIAAALALAQAEMTNAVFNRVNPHFKSKYADLASVREATIKALNKHGIAMVQFKRIKDGELVLVTSLMHKSGQRLDDEFPIAPGNPQQMGSSISYGRRYGWSGLTGIAAEEDDDGNAAAAGGPVKSAHRARKDGDWERMTAEIEAQPDLEGLRQWWGENAGAIFQLPPKWKQLLNEAKEAKKIALSEGVATKDLTFKQQLQASANADPTTGEIINDEIPDPDKFLDGLDNQLSVCETNDDLREVWMSHADTIHAMAKQDQAVADKLISKHRKRVK